MLAINLLRNTKEEGNYELLLAKRGKRAEATHLEGDRTCLLHLKHSSDSILWEQRPKPIVVVEETKPKAERKAKAKPAPKPKPKPTKEELSKLRKEAGTKQIEDLDGLIARIAEPMNKKQIQELAEKHGHGSGYLVKKQWSEIESRLVKTNRRCFQKSTK